MASYMSKDQGNLNVLVHDPFNEPFVSVLSFNFYRTDLFPRFNSLVHLVARSGYCIHRVNRREIYI